MKGVIDGIIKTEHISLNRTAGFGGWMFKPILVLSKCTNTRTDTK